MTREEAIEVYNGLINTKIKEAFEFFAPELRESEDEKIRKDIVAAVEMYGDFTQSRKEEIYAYLEKQKGLTTENNMISSKKCNKSPLTDEAFKEQLERVLRNNVLDTDIRITGDTVIGAKQKEQRSADNVSIEEHIKGFKVLCDDLSKPSIDSGKQKEQNGGIEECTDFTIYHPLKNGKGEYECIPYSFYGSLTSFSEDKDLVDFLRTCFYTKEECNEWIERQKEQKLEEEDHITPNKKFFQWIYDRLVFIHGENPDVDYMRSLKDRIKEMSSKQKSAEVDESTKRLNENWMKQYFDDYKEKKPAEWSEEDKMNLNGCICSLHQYGYMTYADFLKHLPERFNLQPKQEWSEEDEKRIQRICDFLWKNRKGDTDTIYQIEKDADWLKSLRPQPKAEWSEEDEKIITRLIDYFESFRIAGVAIKWEGLDIQEVITLLKSLRPSWKPSEQEKGKKSRKDWKPSEEQMGVLWDAIGNLKHDGYKNAEIVESLYEQLKKLM